MKKKTNPAAELAKKRWSSRSKEERSIEMKKVAQKGLLTKGLTPKKK